MSTFALKKIEAISGKKQEFFDLIIDNKSVLSEFHVLLESYPTYKTELFTLLAYMDFVADMKSLPNNKFKDISPKKSNDKEYEFKTKHLSAYCFHVPGTGKIVAYCGLKTHQKKDILRFRLIKKNFLEQ